MKMSLLEGRLTSLAFPVLLASLTAGVRAQAPNAEAAPLVPLPSVLDYTRGGGFGLALGLGVEYESAYDGADEYEVEFDPRGAVHWRTENHLFFWEGIELGWRARIADRWLVQLNARYEGGREADDSDDGRLDGLDKVEAEIVGVAEARYALDDAWRGWLAARLHVGDDDIGALGVLAAGYRFDDRTDGTGLEAFAYGTFASAEFMDRDFGVSPGESTSSGLEATDLSGGFRAAGVQFVHRENLGEHLQLAIEGGVELYGDEVQESPIARDDFEAEAAVSLVWRF